jgi:hypothetical protein
VSPSASLSPWAWRTGAASVAQAEGVGTTSFELAFETCVVAISRPWLSWPFLLTKAWYLPGYYCGDFAPGGIWPALPVGMIVVRKVAIRATQGAAGAVAHATGFGPISFLGSSPVASAVGGHTDVSVTVDGPQVIGWVCQVLGTLPPLDDPALPPKPRPILVLQDVSFTPSAKWPVIQLALRNEGTAPAQVSQALLAVKRVWRLHSGGGQVFADADADCTLLWSPGAGTRSRVEGDSRSGENGVQ